MKVGRLRKLHKEMVDFRCLVNRMCNDSKAVSWSQAMLVADIVTDCEAAVKIVNDKYTEMKHTRHGGLVVIGP